MVSMTGAGPGRAGTTRTTATSRPAARERKASAAPEAGSEVADAAGEVGRERFDEVVAGGAAVAHRLEACEGVAEAHAFEVAAVALSLLGGGGASTAEGVAEHGGDEGAAGAVFVVVDTDADVLDDLHVVRGAPGAGRALGDAVAAPGDLLGGAPVEGDAVGQFAGEAEHLRAEGAEVDRRARRRVDVEAEAADGNGGAVVGDAFAVEEAAEDGEVVAHEGDGGDVGGAVGLPARCLVEAAGADAEDEPAAGEGADGARAHGEALGAAQGDGGDGDAGGEAAGVGLGGGAPAVGADLEGVVAGGLGGPEAGEAEAGGLAGDVGLLVPVEPEAGIEANADVHGWGLLGVVGLW